jgi:hypothetical protein
MILKNWLKFSTRIFLKLTSNDSGLGNLKFCFYLSILNFVYKFRSQYFVTRKTRFNQIRIIRPQCFDKKKINVSEIIQLCFEWHWHIVFKWIFKENKRWYTKNMFRLRRCFLIELFHSEFCHRQAAFIMHCTISFQRFILTFIMIY